MRYFVLIDLRTQAEFLPPEMQGRSQERFLSWLWLFGEVKPWPRRRFDEHGLTDGFITMWGFWAPSGILTTSVISKNHQFVLVGPGLHLHQILGRKGSLSVRPGDVKPFHSLQGFCPHPPPMLLCHIAIALP
jgi:hypothetical protein